MLWYMIYTADSPENVARGKAIQSERRTLAEAVEEVRQEAVCRGLTPAGT